VKVCSIVERLGLHFTPKHGGWFSIAGLGLLLCWFSVWVGVLVIWGFCVMSLLCGGFHVTLILELLIGILQLSMQEEN